ncbi:hypothetical protein FTX61_11655 [Nitriliruptoraceae bacterium ZYF776]|nr:hypothetical protein [Profundirhabdus halotolerans]
MPTFRSFAADFVASRPKGTRRTYRSPLTRLAEFQPCVPIDPDQPAPAIGSGPECLRLGCGASPPEGVKVEHRRIGDLRLHEVRAGDVIAFGTFVREDEIRNKRRRLQLAKAELIREDRREDVRPETINVKLPPGTGVHGEIGALTAARSLFKRAAHDILHVSPTANVEKPDKPKTKRRAFTIKELDQVIQVAIDTSTDPDLDALLLWFHLESGARQGEALEARVSGASEVEGAG